MKRQSIIRQDRFPEVGTQLPDIQRTQHICIHVYAAYTHFGHGKSSPYTHWSTKYAAYIYTLWSRQKFTREWVPALDFQYLTENRVKTVLKKARKRKKPAVSYRVLIWPSNLVQNVCKAALVCRLKDDASEKNSCFSPLSANSPICIHCIDIHERALAGIARADYLARTGEKSGWKMMQTLFSSPSRYVHSCSFQFWPSRLYQGGFFNALFFSFSFFLIWTFCWELRAGEDGGGDGGGFLCKCCKE